MSESTDPQGRVSLPEGEPAPSEDPVRELIRGALAHSEGMPDLTRGVQQKIRRRSGGKFYADGWSTARHPPITTYLVTSLLMLAVSCLVYALLAPLSGVAESVSEPPPVRVVPAPD